MKCITTVGLVRLALKCLSGVVINRGSTSPVLAMIKLEGSRIEATNIDLTISVSLPTEICEGAALIPYRPFSRLMASCDPSSRVTIEKNDTAGLIVEVDGGIYHMPTIAVDDFPERRDGEFESHKFDGERFSDAISFVLPFASTDLTRYYLHGVHINGSDVVATDGHRLGICTVAAESIPEIIIPTAVAKLLVKLPGITSIDVSKDGRFLRFDAAGVRVQAVLIDGTFPDYRRVIPDTTGMNEWAIPRRAFKSAISRLMAVNCTGIPTVGLLLNRNACALGMKGIDDGYRAGAVVQGCVGTLPEQAIEVGVNGRYLSQAVNNLADDDIRILLSASDSAGPFIIRGEATDRFMVQMPMRDIDNSMARSMLGERRSEAA